MKYLYTVPLPEVSTKNESDSLSQQLAQAGLLDGEGAVVESISQNAADLTLEGQYRWGESVSTKLATELDELASSSLTTLVLFQRGGGYENAGYYEIESADIEPLHANRRNAWTYTLNLTKKGTTNTHFRSIATNPVQVDNEFGNALDALIGVDSAATKQRWFDPETGARAVADPIETRQAEFAAIDVYDPTDTPLDTDTPTLIYELAYTQEGRADPVVWDSRGVAKYDPDADSDSEVNQWQHIFDSSHEVAESGAAIMDNGLLRLQFDEAAGDLSAQEWDSTTEAWTDVAIAISADDEFALYDLDLTHIGDEQDEAQVEFVADDGSLFALDCVLTAGAERAQWIVPDSEEGPVPSALADALDPVASERVVDAQPARDLVSRSEVRR